MSAHCSATRDEFMITADRAVIILCSSLTMMSFFVLLAVVLSCNAQQNYPFRNTSLSIEDRVKDLVQRLTTDEMVLQMARGGAENNGPAPAIDRLGINPYQWGTECISGDVRAGPATSFPQALGMAATFNYDLLYQTAKATSDEIRAKNNDAVSKQDYGFHKGLSCWSPVLNILRDPRWGRNQETYGEDPYLSGYLAKAFVTGLQGDHPTYVEVNAGCKHFDVHGGPENIPVNRFSFDAKVSEQDWRMTFLPQFKACVDAGSWSLMCSYNSINGVPACANKKLLTDILRTEWGFKGYVISDQGAVENIMYYHKYTSTLADTAAVTVNAGTCLEDGNFHAQNLNVFDNINKAIDEAKVAISTVQDAVSRLFTVRMKLGEFDPPDNNPYTKLKTDIIQSDAHRDLSLNATLQTFVLLKNEDNALPLGEVDTACVIGPFIDDPSVLFGDYSPDIMNDYVITPLAGIKGTQIGSKGRNSAAGCNKPICSSYDSNSITNACKGVDVIIATMGTGSAQEREGHDRSDIELPGSQVQMLKDAMASSNSAKVVVVLYNAGPLNVTMLKSNPQVVAILESFFPAQAGGQALAMILSGKYNPAGRLPNTWPMSLDQVPPITNYTMVNRTYRYFQGEPLYPFGYGLSYTTFKYSDLSITPATIHGGDNVTITAMVTNSGQMDGDEVTQVYMSWPNGTNNAPIRQLVGIARTHITQGQSAMLKFEITSDQRMLWDTKWEIVYGQYQVYVGGQQPMQSTTVPSNILMGSFTVSQ